MPCPKPSAVYPRPDFQQSRRTPAAARQHFGLCRSPVAPSEAPSPGLHPPGCRSIPARGSAGQGDLEAAPDSGLPGAASKQFSGSEKNPARTWLLQHAVREQGRNPHVSLSSFSLSSPRARGQGAPAKKQNPSMENPPGSLAGLSQEEAGSRELELLASRLPNVPKG